jgi:hypothetical protein
MLMTPVARATSRRLNPASPFSSISFDPAWIRDLRKSPWWYGRWPLMDTFFPKMVVVNSIPSCVKMRKHFAEDGIHRFAD